MSQNAITEERLYQQLALVSSSLAFSWSKWNSEIDDTEKIVFQGNEHLVDEPLQEVNNWHKEHALVFSPYSAVINFRRQDMTSVDFIQTFKVDPRTVKEKIFIMDVDP